MGGPGLASRNSALIASGGVQTGKKRFLSPKNQLSGHVMNKEAGLQRW